ncbi:MAG: RdgB/HAM1 family non-canonical purine NTP pyrophosphatase [Deltaproteobacteria bacterium]|nr:RdgB/HAM1 family non-canonical purine NTP pyrophosphatase [Deltaproteobacteria bacterium]
MGNKKRVVLATRNNGKVRELTRLFSGIDIELETLNDHPEVGELAEDGDTFEDNALQKAREAAGQTGLPAIADDSGLVVDALSGRPGVFSARYGKSVEQRNNRLLTELKGLPPEKRTARFVCVMVYYEPGGKPVVARGTCEGRIATSARGRGGFGYDPIFEIGRDRTMAELEQDEKNRISHRGKAARELALLLADRFQGSR